MKSINSYIKEALIKKDTKISDQQYHPKDLKELKSLLKFLLERRGQDADLNDIDVSQITTFYDENNDEGLFEYLDPRNIKIDKWDVSNVEDMSYTFCCCTDFTGKGLENWKPIKCKDMSCMFDKCKKFNCNLSKWDVSNVNKMTHMFDRCTNFTGDGLENWKPIKCKKMNNMFDDCYSLKNYPSWYKE